MSSMIDCKHTHTQFDECAACGAVLDRLSTACPKPQKRVEDPAYRTFVRGLVCCAILLDGPGRCEGDNIPHHARGGTMGRKADDSSCIALCTWHHRTWHDASGPFANWDRATRREWSEDHISETRAMWRERQKYERES